LFILAMHHRASFGKTPFAVVRPGRRRRGPPGPVRRDAGRLAAAAAQHTVAERYRRFVAEGTGRPADRK
jgi:hypothetical protein